MIKAKTLFVIDDDAIYQLITQKELEQHGPHITCKNYYNGASALQALQELPEPPAIILLDLNMPIMDGWEFLEAYQQLPTSLTQHIQLYVVSSSIDYRDIDRAKENPLVSDFIIKPITSTNFSQILQ
ncbi:MAG: response regulator [Bacteroidetes bacterium]|nr:MAG: response regulator [Bacteroidota bacterium]TAF91533.1 MAG: response regulator [Bacteroidota bacterium]